LDRHRHECPHLGSKTGERRLWRKRFAPAETVSLGTTGTVPDATPAAPYLIIARAARPSHIYDPVAQPLAQGGVEWEFSVGVGDRYGLDIRYASTAEENRSSELAVVNPDGSIFCTRALEFPPTSGRWDHVRTRTCESINAGTYRIRISDTSPDEVRFGTLEVE
jgi:hypothetical protein